MVTRKSLERSHEKKEDANSTVSSPCRRVKQEVEEEKRSNLLEKGRDWRWSGTSLEEEGTKEELFPRVLRVLRELLRLDIGVWRLLLCLNSGRYSDVITCHIAVILNDFP